MTGREPGLESLLRLADRIEHLGDSEVYRLLTIAAATNSTALKRRIEKILVKKAAKHRILPFDFTGSWEVYSQQKVSLGLSYTGGRFDLRNTDFARHFLTVGQSGAGKTTLFYNLLGQIEVPFWVFDLKQDYRHLVQDQDDLLVLPWTRFRFNPLRPPPGVSPSRWGQVFAEIFGHATALLSGSKNYLMKKIIELYTTYNLFERVEPPFPSLHELQVLVDRDKINYVRTSANYRDRLLNRLEAMTLTAGEIFDCSQGPPIKDLLQRNVVFEFDGLSRDLQNFLMEILFAYVYEYRLAQNQRNTGLRHVFLLDEGKRVFSVYKERQDASGIPEIDELTAKMREFGEGLIVGDQEASKLTDSIKANTYTKVLLPTGDRKQFKAMTESMNLSQRQVEFASQLGTGEAIVQVGNGDPIPVKLDNYQLDKTVTDEQLQEEMADKWQKLSYEDREFTPEFELEVDFGISSEDQAPETEDSSDEIKLTDEADRLLKDVVEKPFKSLTERYDRFSSRHKGNKAKNELVDQGIVFERRVKNLDGRKLLELTDKGREYAEEHLELDTKQRGRGGIVHQYWQHRIKEIFDEAGWQASLEKFDADIFATMGNTEVVIEVAMGDNHREIGHVKQHLDQGFDAIWVLCRNQGILDGLKQRMQENQVDMDRVLFRLLRDFNSEVTDSIKGFR